MKQGTGNYIKGIFQRQKGALGILITDMKNSQEEFQGKEILRNLKKRIKKWKTGN